jgi:Kelch motif
MARPTASGSVFLVAFALAVGLGYSCGDSVPLEELDCPCLTVGFVCCKATNKCLKADAGCADTDAAVGTDGSGGATGGTGATGGSGGTAGTGATGGMADAGPADRPAANEPTVDRWTAMSSLNAPSQRIATAAVWTGKELIVWGGSGDVPLATGSRYDPATDRWTIMATLRSPTARYEHSAVWTGTEMIVWGGSDGSNDSLDTGARYNPATDTWTPMARPTNVLGRGRHQAAWTGSRMVVWGGAARRGLVPASGGGRYDPATDSWQSIATEGGPIPTEGTPPIWSGSELLLFGGAKVTGPSPAGPIPFVGPLGLYNPAQDRWSPMSSGGAPSDRAGHLVVWSGTEALVWGGSTPQLGGSGMEPALVGGIFSPARNTWRSMSRLQQPTVRHGAIGVFATGAGSLGTGLMLVIGGPAQGGAYDPASDQWWPLSMQDAPVFSEAVAVWTGKHMLVWGTTLAQGGPVAAGARYEP